MAGVGGALKRFGSFFGFTEEELTPAVNVEPVVKVEPPQIVTPAAAMPSPQTPKAPEIDLVATQAAIDAIVHPVSAAVTETPIVRGLAANDDEDVVNAAGQQIVTPQERIARSFEERSNTSESVVTIKDETGRAEVSEGELGKGVQLRQSGEF